MTIIGVLAGLVVVLIPKGREKANIADCTNNIKQLTGLLIATKGQRFPSYGGVNLLLFLNQNGDLPDEAKLQLLFCPGDERDTWERSGGLPAYKAADLTKKGEYGILSSYAGRDQTDRDCAASKSTTKTQAIMADDSQDHHNDKGFVIGYNDAAAKYKEKFTDWKIQIETEVKVGEGSEIEDLKCLLTDDN